MKARLALLLLCVLGPPAVGQDPSSPNAKERARAAEALASQGSAAIPTLEKLLKDPELRVRREAVRSLVKIGTQHSLDPLIQATKDPDPEIQIQAVNGLVNFYLPGYIKTGWMAPFQRTQEAITGYFTDTNDAVVPPDMRVREDVIEAAGRLASGGSSMKSRANAARAVGVLRGRQAVPHLLEAVRSKNTEVIYESLIALQKIGDKSAAPAIAFLLRDLSDKVLIAAIETTGLLQNRDALPRLYEILERPRNKEVRRAALTAIAMLPDEESRRYYTQYIQDKDPELRAAAAEGIARLKNPADRPRMQSYFEAERKMSPRLSMAFALVMLGQTELSEFSPLQYLVNTLNTSSYHGIAEPFLLELARQPAVRQSLYQALPTASKDEKIHLARVLARSGDSDTIPHLEALSRDLDAEVATAASQALRILRARVQ